MTGPMADATSTTSVWGIAGVVITTLGVIVVAWLTRRTAKDQTAVTGFAELTKSLQEQIDRQDKRIDRQETRIGQLEEQVTSAISRYRAAVRYIRLLRGWIDAQIPGHTAPPVPSTLEADLDN